MESIELLRRLTDAFGPSGFEDEVRGVVRDLVEPLVDEVRVDTLGNLLATRRGRSDMTLLIDAHLDEIGLMVTWVEDQGFLRFTTIGGWDPRVLPANIVTIQSDTGQKVKGAIGVIPPHLSKPEERDRAHKVEDLFIDVGATSAAEVADLGIRIGSPAVVHYPFEVLAGGRAVLAKALDDRAGCAVLVRVLEELRGVELDVTLVAAFTVQEEVGLRGAETAAWQVDPDIAIALEGTSAADVPGIAAPRTPTRQSRGPSVRVMDSSMIGNPRMIRALANVADRDGIPFQYQVPAPGGTDAGIIHRTRAGVLAGAVSIPCRYIHSPVSTLRLDDFENAVRLVTAFSRACPEAVEGQER